MPINYDEAHAILDAVMNFDNPHYDVMIQTSAGKSGKSFEVHVFDMRGSVDDIKLIESKHVPEDVTAWDAIKMIAKYKEESNNA